MTHTTYKTALIIVIFTLGDEQQERTERAEQAKEKTRDKALATRQAALINTRGDELMYSPVKHFTAPTITGSA